MFNLENLNDNYFTELNPEEILQIKEMSVEDKVTCFKYFLDSEIITNVSVISNIFLLINGISNIDDDTIDDERIFFKSLEEYVDIKLQIRYEIDKFNIRLLEYYFGIIEGLEVVLDELKTHIPNTHFNIMPLVTPQLISRLMTKYLTKLSAERVKPHFNANELYNKIHNPDSLVNGFLMTLSEEI
jgi:hypothetical protein